MPPESSDSSRFDHGADSGKIDSGVPETLYRNGRPSPGNVKQRPGEDGVSFWDRLANPWPLLPGQQPVFPAGKPYFSIDPSKLPGGSNVATPPEGHWIVKDVPPDVIKEAVRERGAFPG